METTEGNDDALPFAYELMLVSNNTTDKHRPMGEINTNLKMLFTQHQTRIIRKSEKTY